MAFATPADMQLFADSRRLQQLVSDSGTPATDLDNNPVLLALLARASEEVLASALKGKRYTTAELQALADSGEDGYYLVGLVCDLAFGYLVQRRGTGAADMDRQAPAFRKALTALEQLSSGELIFPLTEDPSQEDAGTPRTADLTNQITTPCSYVSRAYLTLLPTRKPNGFNAGSCGSC